MVSTTISYQATDIGSGTAETTLNSGNVIIIPDSIRELISYSPFVVPSGALTADQQHVVRFRWTSDDISMTPKDLIWNYLGVLDGTGQTQPHPVMQSWELHVGTTGNENVTATGTSIAATTVGMLMGLQTFQSTGRTGKPQQYWANPSAETATGTAAATVTGSTYTTNNVKAINWVSAYATPAAAAASDSMGGLMTLNSPDFQSALPVSFPTTPYIGGLAADTIESTIEQVKIPVMIPTRQNVSITESFASAQAVAADGTFMSMIGFLR